MKILKYHFSIIIRGLITALKIEKRYVFISLSIEILTPLIPYVNIYMAAKIIDELLGNKDRNLLFTYVIITICADMFLAIVINGLKHMKNYYNDQFYQNQEMLFSKKILSMDYIHLEDNSINRLLERVKAENRSGYNMWTLCNYTGVFVKSAISLIISIFLTFSLFTNPQIMTEIKWIIILLIFIVAFSTYFAEKKVSKIYLTRYENFVPLNGIYNFYNNYYNDYSAWKDIRLYKMEDILSNEQIRFNEMISTIYSSTTKESVKYLILNGVLTDILKIIVYIVLIISCNAGSISVGSITKYVSCIIQFITAISLIVSSTQRIISNNNYLKNYFLFLDIPQNMYNGMLKIDKRNKYKLEFKNVSFKYPGCDHYAIKDLSVKLVVGQRMAVVGMNGSGKTTFIKLLCRLYDPTEGQITLNGCNIKDYSYKEYLSLFSIVFQDFKLFAFSINQNVAASENLNNNKVKECLSLAGFDERLKTLPKELETSLYKSFDENGVEISGGEAQKIALARALYKNVPFIVLDEPTSALDPISEYEIYSKFNEIVGDRTAIYISHRLSSCRFSDDIIVFHEGVLIQRGRHDKLVKDINGKYYELWNAQLQYYAEKKRNELEITL